MDSAIANLVRNMTISTDSRRRAMAIKRGRKGVRNANSIIGHNASNDTFLVQWAVGSPSWEPRQNINPLMIDDYNMLDEIKSHNDAIPNPTKLAFPYFRISRGFQQGVVSIDIQKARILQFCRENQFHIASLYTDIGHSAKDMNNLIALQKLLSDVNDVSDFKSQLPREIIVFDVSRFSRNSTQAINILDILNKQKVNTYFLSEGISYDNASSRHMIRTHLSNAQFLSEQTSEKVISAIRYKRSKGLHIGSIKFGFYAPNGILIKNPSEQKIIKKVYDLYMTEKYNFEQLANKLNYSKETFRGKPFTTNNIRICINRSYEK